MRNQPPTVSEFGRLRSYLAQQGVSQSQINSVIGTGANGRTRAQIADELKVWLRGLPKAAP